MDPERKGACQKAKGQNGKPATEGKPGRCFAFELGLSQANRPVRGCFAVQWPPSNRPVVTAAPLRDTFSLLSLSSLSWRLGVLAEDLPLQFLHLRARDHTHARTRARKHPESGRDQATGDRAKAALKNELLLSAMTQIEEENLFVLFSNATILDYLPPFFKSFTLLKPSFPPQKKSLSTPSIYPPIFLLKTNLLVAF